MREEDLFSCVVDIIDAACVQVARSVNAAMPPAYRRIGREIVKVEQDGQRRAGYGDEVIERLGSRGARVGASACARCGGSDCST